MPNEWATDDPRGKLEIPTERLATQRYRFAARDARFNGTCAGYELLLNAVRLIDVLVDTSDQAQGITLIKRVTHRRELVCAQTALSIFPFNDDETMWA